MTKLACRADLEYNGSTKLLTSAMLQTSARLRRILIGDASMPTIPQDDTPRKQSKSQADRAYRQAHVEERRAYQKVYRQTHIEERRAYHKAYGQTHSEERRVRSHAHADHIREKQRAYRAAHAEKISMQRRAYRLAHIEEERANTNNRHARKKANGGTHTASDIQKQYTNQKGRCYYCHAKVGKVYEVDHVIPLSRGGTNDPSNLVIACPPCNAKKYNKLPHEWREGGRLL